MAAHLEGGRVHRGFPKTRIPARNAMLAFAPLAALYLAAAERVTLGGSLDLLWLLLTVSSVIHCLQQRVSGASRVPQLLSLALMLALFFPVISLDDDRALAEMPIEQQSALMAPEKQKTSHPMPVAHVPALVAAPPCTVWLHVATDQLAPARAAICRFAWRPASGNHSPPLA